MTAALEQLNESIPTNPHVHLLSKAGGWISLSPLPPQPQPQHLRLLKGELGTRWPMIELLDILKETDLRVRFTDRFHTQTLRENLDRAMIQKRLLLGLYGLGTNIGLKRVCAGDQSESYRDVLYICRRFLTKDALRAAIADVATAIFRVRRPDIWGEGTTACASDSKKYAAWDQNLMTEWHPRYRGPGVLIRLPRRAQSRLYLLATQSLHLLRSRRHDHRAVAPRLRNAGRAQLCRYPRTIGNRVCFLFLVGLSALAPPEESACPKALSS